MGESPLYIHNVYVLTDPSAKKRFFEELPSDFESDVEHVVCGDFNTAIDLNLSSYKFTSAVGVARNAWCE